MVTPVTRLALHREVKRLDDIRLCPGKEDPSSISKGQCSDCHEAGAYEDAEDDVSTLHSVRSRRPLKTLAEEGRKIALPSRF